MKIKDLIGKGRVLLILQCLFAWQAFAQAPSISYSGSQSYIIGTPVTPLSPSNSGGAVYSIGQTSTFAGSGSVGAYNGTGTAATFNHPLNVAVDAAGNVYVADRLNYLIRKISTSGAVSTLAGSGTSGYFDATGTGASFALPNDIALDASGNLFVADEWNNMIRQVSPSGVVTTFAGSTTAGYVNATGTAARFNYPFGICSDASGNLYVADLNNGAVRKVTPSGAVTTLAAGFGNVLEVACDAAGYVYVVDANSNIIYKVTPTGTVNVFAGSGSAGSSNGTGASASFNHPAGIAIDPSGNVYIGDEVNNQIRKITPAGVVTTIAGSGSAGSSNGSGSSATFNYPCGVAYDNTSGSLFVADYSNNMVRKVIVAPYTISPALPAGLNFDPATGTISGTPTAMSAATTYTITAYNASGPGSTTVTISSGTGISSPSDQNYILTFTPRTEISDIAQLSTSGVSDVNQSITYLDGLGRPIQNVVLKGNGDGTKDLVQPIAYDEYGRQAKKYMPYTTSIGDPISYRADALTIGAGVNQFYNPTGSGISGAQQSNGVVTIPKPFAQTNFEPSPLNRPVEQGAPGDAWQPVTGSTAGNTMKTVYGTNTDADDLNQVLLWTINSTGGATNNNARYVSGQLYKMITIDENGNNSVDFRDKQGHVVCKKAQLGASNYLSTYYIYDDYNNLAYVIPPIPATVNYPTSFTEANTDAIFTSYVYAYHYDSRDRLVEKKLPGKGWDMMVYNTIDQVVATQDSNQRIHNQWLFTKYDAIGRVVLTGIWDNSNTAINRSSLQSTLNSQSTHWEANTSSSNTYTASWPASWTGTLTNNFYDNYNFSAHAYGPWNSGTISSPNGMLTGAIVSVLKPDGTVGDQLLTEYQYDDKGRVAQTSQQHYLGGHNSYSTGNYDVNIPTYDFSNAIIANTRFHVVNNIIPLRVANVYYYDPMGRRTSVYETITVGSTTLSEVLLSHATYNEVGQLYMKGLHSSNYGSTYLQSIGYYYNERGWLRTASSSSGLFNMELQYETPSTGKQYNGNISRMDYNTTSVSHPGSRSFNYTYDKLNRLTVAGFSGGSTGDELDEAITYDAMGNITQLIRGGTGGGTLNYTGYTGNQLNTVIGYSPRTYVYDGNGNATSNGNGKSIDYNLFNLPREIRTGSTELANYTYDASGNKLSNYSTASGANDGNWEYINGIVYHNSAVAFITTEEGRAVPDGGNYKYEYNLKDHLGNTRVSIDSYGGAARVIQEDEYYSFGLRKPTGGYNYSNNNRYLYNGKEVQTDLTDQYDYGARFYDPVIARWTSADPLAEGSRRWNPYTYGKNNPIRTIDPDGMWDWVVGGSAGNQPVWDDNVHSDADAERLHGKGATDVTKDGNYNYRSSNGRGVVLYGGDVRNWDYTFAEMSQEIPTGNGFEGLQSGIRQMGPLLSTASTIAEVTAYSLIPGGEGAIGTRAVTNEISEVIGGIERARQLGVAGEEAVGITGPKVAIEVAGRTRIPDRITDIVLEEVKNVAHQNFTRQLRDFYQYAQDKGLQMILHTRSTTTFSKPLQELIDNGFILQKVIPGL